MTVFYGNQVVLIDYGADASQQLLDASLVGDLRSTLKCITDSFVDINFVSAVFLEM